MKSRITALLVVLLMILSTAGLADETIDKAIGEWESWLEFNDVLYRTAEACDTALNAYAAEPTPQTLLTARLTLSEGLRRLAALTAPSGTLTDAEIVAHSEADLLTILIELNGYDEESGTAYLLEAEYENEAAYQRALYNGELLYQPERLEIYREITGLLGGSLEQQCRFAALESRGILETLDTDRDAVWDRWKQAYPYVLRYAEEAEAIAPEALETEGTAVLDELEALNERHKELAAELRGYRRDAQDAMATGTYTETLALRGELPAVMPLPDWDSLRLEASPYLFSAAYLRQTTSGELVPMSASDTGPIALCMITVYDVSREEYDAYIAQAEAAGYLTQETDGSTEERKETVIRDPETDVRITVYHQDTVAELWLPDRDILLLRQGL